MQNMVQSSIYVKTIVYYEISQENIEIGYGEFGLFWYYSINGTHARVCVCV